MKIGKDICVGGLGSCYDNRGYRIYGLDYGFSTEPKWWPMPSFIAMP